MLGFLKNQKSKFSTFDEKIKEGQRLKISSQFAGMFIPVNTLI